MDDMRICVERWMCINRYELGYVCANVRDKASILACIKELLERHQLDTVTALLIETIEFQFGSDEVLEDVTLHLNGSVPSTKEANVEQMALELMELGLNILPMITIGASPGELCPQAEAMNLNTNQLVTLDTVVDTKITLLDVWASWCSPSLEVLVSYDTLLEKNQQWKDAVTIITLNLDDNMADARSALEQVPSHRTHHLWMSKDACDLHLSVNAIPTWFLFQHGRIVWRGHPSSIDLEATIPSLQEGNGVVPAPENDGALGPTPGLSDLQDFSDDQLLEFCQSLQARVSELALPDHTVSCSLESSITVTSDKDDKHSRRLVLAGPAQFASACADLEALIRSTVAGNVYISFSD
eukprot:gene5549-175_t